MKFISQPVSKLLAWTLVLSGFVLYLFLPEIFPGNDRLYDAIANGDEAKVVQLLKSGADPNSRARGFLNTTRSNRYQFYPLHYALWRNKPKIAMRLIEAGADPNARDRQGRTALIVAANSGYADVVQALLTKGADPRAASSGDGETPLRMGPKGPGGLYPLAGNFAKSLKPEIRAMLERAGAR